MTTDSIPALDEDHDTIQINTDGGEGVILDSVAGKPIDEKDLAEQLLAQAKAQGVSLVGPGWAVVESDQNRSWRLRCVPN